MEQILSKFKTVKWMTSSDLKKILPDIEIIGIQAGPVMMMNNKSYTAKAYRFKTLDELISHFSGKTQVLLVYDYQITLPALLKVNKGDKIKITGKHESHITCDCDAKITFTFTDSNMDNNYTDYMIRIYEEIDVNNDNFQDCDSIEECIVPQVMTKLNKIK